MCAVGDVDNYNCILFQGWVWITIILYYFRGRGRVSSIIIRIFQRLSSIFSYRHNIAYGGFHCLASVDVDILFCMNILSSNVIRNMYLISTY